MGLAGVYGLTIGLLSMWFAGQLGIVSYTTPRPFLTITFGFPSL